MMFVLAAIVGALAAAPLFASKHFKLAAVFGAANVVAAYIIIYFGLPSLVWPLWGSLAALVLLDWVISAVIHLILTYDEDRRYTASRLPFYVVICGFLVVTFRVASGCSAIRAPEYAALLGPMENREWTQDIQPADPKHIRLVPPEMAVWLADKQLGAAPGAIGSQFEIKENSLTLQMVRGELWYVAALDFKDFGTWQSTKAAPGYVMVHAEDPLRPVVVKTDERFAFMPHAYFSLNLERHLWTHGYASSGLTDYSFEIDEAGKAWWVVTVFEPTIAYGGEKVLGVAIVDPTDGAIQFHPTGKAPEWVDRVFPHDIVKMYVDKWGDLSGGWFNSWWSEQDLTKPEDVSIVYGADGQPYWVSGITSQNSKDNSLVRLIYTNSRTGKSVSYHAKGGTESAVLAAVNNKVSYRKWHGSGPVLYNLYGQMVSIVPLLGDNHTYQGVAIVKVDNLQVAVGESQQQALREFQKIMNDSGQQIAPEVKHARRELSEAKVDRFAVEMQNGEPAYFLHLEGVPHIFTGGNGLSQKLRLTRAGDAVRVAYSDSGEDVMPLMAFDNLSFEIKTTPAEDELRDRVEKREGAVDTERSGPTTRESLSRMNDEELKRLMELRDKAGKDGGK